MKKIIISIGLCLVGFVTVAQNVDEVNNAAFVNKRGVYLLPQAGDFALGIDASPILGYLGNIFSSSGNYAPDLSSQTIYGKYFLEDNRAIRVKLSLGLFNTVNKGFVRDDVAYEDDYATDKTVIDVERISNSFVGLNVGYEFRRGSGRVQGFYGGEVMLGYDGGKNKYDYANRMNEDNTNPSSFNFDGRNLLPYRVIQSKNGTFFAGLGAFAGAEYFIAPQVSLGCEVGLGFIFSSTGKRKTTFEKWDIEDEKAKIQTVKDVSGEKWRNARNFQVGTYTGNGFFGEYSYSSVSIFLMFHF